MQSEQCVETAARRDTILVVDDVELNRVILSEAFREGYRLLEAENGRQALDLVLAEPDRICAILLDVVMPVMDGFAFLEEMRARDLLAREAVWTDLYTLAWPDLDQARPGLEYTAGPVML